MARPRQVTDEQILEAARRSVLEDGAQVSLDAIAQRLGVTSPALIKRFGTRENLFIAALVPDQSELDECFDDADAERSFPEQLESLIDRLSDYFARTMPRMMALRECGVSDEVIRERIKLPIPVRAVDRTTRWLEAMKRDRLIDGDMLATAASAIVGAISMRMISAHLSKRPWSKSSQRKYQSELAEMFCRALDARVVQKRKMRGRT